MKTYIGERLEHGCEVYVLEDGKRRPLSLRLDLRNHSPEGFEWGYGGSGPAQLALAILADCLGPDTPPERCPYCESAMRGWTCTEPECAYDGNKCDKDQWRTVLTAYQDFKGAIIASLADHWTIDEQAIRLWLGGAQLYSVDNSQE